MPELRRDPLSGRWVVVAPERVRRPTDLLARPGPHAKDDFCPFCEGNESATPHEIHAFRGAGTPPNAPGWRVRTIPNRRPALRIEGELGPQGDGIYDRTGGVGAHEVIVDTPRHVRSIADLSRSEVEEVVWMYRDRMHDLKRDRRLVHGVVYKNVGAAAGATIEHSHSQLVCLPSVARAVADELPRAEAHFLLRGRCLTCDLVRQESASRARLVEETPSVLVVAPYAARFPFECWIVPRTHRSHFEDLNRDESAEVAACLRATIRRIERALDRPAYNFWLRSAPFDRSALSWYHWRIEVVPRIYPLSGFEGATDQSINPVASEQAAEYLRTMEVADQ